MLALAYPKSGHNVFPNLLLSKRMPSLPQGDAVAVPEDRSRCLVGEITRVLHHLHLGHGLPRASVAAYSSSAA